MIDIRGVWLPEMIRYCELVGNRDRLLSAFNQSPEDLWTSVTSYDELLCQIFDDLAVRTTLDDPATKHNLPTDPYESLREFVATLDQVDAAIPEGAEPDFDGDAWKTVEISAQHVMRKAKDATAAGYSFERAASAQR